MTRTWFVARLSITLTLLTLSVLSLASALGLIPDPEALALAARLDVARALQWDAAAAVQARDVRSFELAARQLIDEHSQIRTAGLRDDGGLIIDVGGHAARWSDPGRRPDAANVWLPVEMNGAPWGRVELTFRPPTPPVLLGLLPGGSVGRLYAFVAAFAFGAFGLYLWFVLGRVFAAGEQAIPHRVRQALDTLVEGVLVLDRRQCIAHANAAFGRLIDRPAAELIGQSASSLAWSPPRGVTFAKPGLPWSWAIHDGQSVNRVPLILHGAGDREHMLSVNATPVVADDGTRRGALATFDDMTELERKHTSLHELLSKLKKSRAEIHRQNHELKLLANRDPLTLCLNRRAFFVDFTPLFEQAGRTGAALSCLMVDVDRFKSVNDRYGHAAGDRVLAQVAEVLRAKSRHTDLVCRYGGEEFALILPQTDLEEAGLIAERIRVALAEKPLAGVPVTASFGVSAISLGPSGPQGLLDQADRAMYAAKRMGRNRVARYDELPADAEPAPRRGPRPLFRTRPSRR
jgi:diguanylate cyclase (GGDEF)-like protein